MDEPSALLEAGLQEQIAQGLLALGYVVLVTSARRVREGYGSDHGVPDLIVTHPRWGLVLLGIEVKRPNAPVRWSHDRQRELWQAGHTAVARSLEDACLAIAMLERNVLGLAVPLSLPALRLASAVPTDRRREVLAHGL